MKWHNRILGTRRTTRSHHKIKISNGKFIFRFSLFITRCKICAQHNMQFIVGALIQLCVVFFFFIVVVVVAVVFFFFLLHFVLMQACYGAIKWSILLFCTFFALVASCNWSLGSLFFEFFDETLFVCLLLWLFLYFSSLLLFFFLSCLSFFFFRWSGVLDWRRRRCHKARREIGSRCHCYHQ